MVKTDKNQQRLKDINEAIDNVSIFIQNKSFEDLNADLILKSAIMAQLMIMGEAAKHLNEDFKIANNQIDWNKIIGLRNILIHEYFGIEWEIVWDTIKEDIPKLKKDLAKLLDPD